MMNNLKNCHDCGAEPGYTHSPNCDVERCSYCGGQCLQCGGCPDAEGKMRHDPVFARWTGLWPGRSECISMNLFAKFPGQNGKWEKCGASDPNAVPDLNTFYELGYHKVFFIKPSKENKRER
jgi:hypothetical protein